VDPTALLAAAPLVANNMASEAIKDAYTGLKNLIKGRVGRKAEADLILDRLDEKPAVWEQPVRALLAEYQIEKDPEVVQAARKLMDLIGPSQMSVGDRNIQVGTMNVEGNTYIVGGDFSNKPYETQALVQSDQDKAAVLLGLAVLRGDGFRLRNRAYSLTDEEALNSWKAEAERWNQKLIETTSRLDPIDAELLKVLGNMPIRKYPNTNFLNDEHLLLLSVLDERLTRLEAVIGKHHTLLING